ncbi:MAG: hypothetical protein ACREAK_11400, partial [Nitrosarchaeum sp.]
FIYDSVTNIFMKTTNKKTVIDKLKKVRIEKKTDEEFHLQMELKNNQNFLKKVTRENHIKQFSKL